jgi:hypothetical protein
MEQIPEYCNVCSTNERAEGAQHCGRLYCIVAHNYVGEVETTVVYPEADDDDG